MKWFKHDSSAHSDAKLQKLLIKYGTQGYGLYWYCLQCIAGNVNEHNLTFELEHDAEILAHHCKVDTRMVEEIMLYMVNLGLFEGSSGVITCLKMAKRLDQSMTSNPQMRRLITQVKEQNHDGVMTNHDSIMQDKIRLDKNRKDKTITSPSAKVPACPVSKIVDLYHEKLPTLPRTQKLTAARESHIRQRWREDLPALKNWENYFSYISQSDFLMGRAEPRPNKKPFLANLEWITKAGNYAKILEGNYHGI